MIRIIRSSRALAQILILTMICTLFQMNVSPIYANEGALKADQAGEARLHSFQLLPSDDAYVRSSNALADSNFGEDKALVIKKGNPDLTRESYMKFDFAGFSAEVESVTLVVYGAAGEGNQASIQLHKVTDNNWSEKTITWNTKPSYESQALSSITLDKTVKSYEIDITEQVIEQLAADKMVSIAFVQPEMPGGQGLVVILNSKENTIQQPYVEVKYRAPEDAAAPVWPSGSELKAIQSADDAVDLQWTSAVDNQMVVSYRIYQDDMLIATVPTTQKHYRVEGLAPKQSYSFKVEAGDPSNNWSLDGPEAAVTMPNLVKLPAIEDTYVNAGGASQMNYGTSDKLLVKNMKADPNVTRQSFIKFDTEALTDEIGTATLNFYGAVADGGGSAIDTVVFGLEDHSWKEAEMTWATKPEAVHYLSKVPMNVTRKWHQVDVTSYVKDQIRKGKEKVSFGLLQLVDVGLVVSINSRENTENQPYLSISSSQANAAAPSWPASSILKLQNMEEEAVDLQWGAAADPAGVTQYRIYQNGTLIDTISSQATTYSVEGLTVGERYTFKVEAGNAAGEWSQDGPLLTVTLPNTKFKQTVLGNVFLNNEPVQFIVETVRPNVSWKAFNLNGTKVAEGTAQAHNGQATITVPDRGLGYFTLEAQAENSGSSPIMLETTYSVLTPFTAPANGNSPFGFNTHLHRIAYGWNADLVKLVKYAGATFVRDGVEWQYIEKEKGIYSYFPDLENYMARLKQDGIPMLFVAAYNNQFYDNNGTPYTDEGRLGMANYAKAYVEKYKDQIIAMNVYNEFNGGFGKRGNSPANSQPDYYYKLLKKTYEVVHAEHPDLPIVGIVSAGISLDWIEEVLKLGGMDYLDAIAVQEYVYPNAPEELAKKLEDLKALIKKYNDGKLVPIWLTEFGWPTYVGSRGINEKLQADYLLRGHVIALSSGVDKMIWYDLMDDGMQTDLNEDNFGIIRNEKSLLGAHTAKPAYVSYAVMTRELTGAQFEEVEAVDEPIHSYRFVKDQQPVRVVWATEDTIINIATDTPIEITDLMGNTELYAPLNGKVILSLTGEPYYVKGDVGQISVEPSITINGEATVIGDAGQFTVSMTNTGKSKLSFTMDVEGKAHLVTIEPGQSIEKAITVEDTREGYRYIPVYLMVGEQKVGKLGYELKVDKAKEVKVRPILEQAEGAEGQYDQALHIEVTNFSKLHALQVKEVEWSVGNQSGRQAWNISIPPMASEQIRIPLPAFGFGENYKASVRVKFNDLDVYQYEGNFGFNPILQRTVNISGEIEPELEALAPTIDLSKGKEVLLSGFSGKIDVRGKIWMNYDRDHLYLTAQIKDEIHSAKAVGNQIWNNDSIQFAVTSGVPGESSSWYEIGLSDTPDGPQMYRFAAPPGIDKGPIKNGKLVVKRDESKKVTVYQMALPWSELSPVLPLRNEVMSFSLLVNDNNGNGRRGWMEWGSGIGLEKRASLFRTMQWVHTELAPVAFDGSYTVKTGSELQGTLQADHAEGTALTYEIVGQSKQGTVELTDAVKGEFVYKPNVSALGDDAFTFRVHDGYGYSNTATVKIAIVRPGEDASLKELQLNGVTVAGFDPDTTKYTIVLDKGAELPEITAVAADEKATVTIKPAKQVPGVAKVQVTSESGAQTRIYEIHFQLRPVERPLPKAHNASYTTKAGVPVEGQLRADHAEGTTLIYEIAASGKKGTAKLTDAAQGKFVYTPTAGASGEDTFTYRVHDGHNYSNTATVTIAIEKAPVEPSVDPPVYPGVIEPDVYRTNTGQLYLPGGAAGEVSLGQQITLTIPAGATDTGSRIIIEELEKLDGPQLQLLSPMFQLRREPAGELKKTAVLRLAFDAKQVGKDQYPSLQRYDEQQKKWIEIGGKVENGGITAEISQFGIYAVFALERQSAGPEPENELKDIAGHWGQSWIEKAVQAGIVKGYSDSTFRPDQAVSRQELVAMLVRALQPQAGTGKVQSFTDQARIGNWAADAVAAAAQAGWITGYSDGSFRPQEGITRVELAAVLARASAGLTAEGDGQLSQFRDAEQIPAWAAKYVAAAAASGLMEGTGAGLFKPAGIVTRAEAAAIAMRLIEQTAK
ncbi:DNRLRE domain-containing protein [Paenibacillus sp. GCM10027626]|uniref:CBM96 family carbohydrate-binding protein n=1 Tax=Paenibacillus sp. GCM10027626 TaxID=3273411 RepID=UPI0036453C55